MPSSACSTPPARNGQPEPRPPHERSRTLSFLPVSLAIYARALAWGGDAERGEAVRSEAAALIDALSDDELARRRDAIVDLGGAEIYLDCFEEAGKHCERALQVGRATGQDQLFPGVNATLGVAWCMLGRLVEAAELLDAAIEAGRLSGNPQALAWALFCRAFVALPAGDTRVAIATAEESLDLATAAGRPSSPPAQHRSWPSLASTPES